MLFLSESNLDMRRSKRCKATRTNYFQSSEEEREPTVDEDSEEDWKHKQEGEWEDEWEDEEEEKSSSKRRTRKSNRATARGMHG